MAEYIIRCWNCMGEYDALSAVWCSCNPNKPTKVCPFCLQCFCKAPDEYHAAFWASAPEELLRDREMLVKARGPLGEALIRANVITSEQLLFALKRQKDTGEKLGEALVDMGLLTHDILESFLSNQRSMPRISLKDKPPDPMLIASIGAEKCRELSVIPISRERLGDRVMLTLAMADPSDGDTIERLQESTGAQILAAQASKDEIERYLAPFLAPSPAGAEKAAVEQNTGFNPRMATELIREALSRGASDLYIEPTAEQVTVRLRIDGILYRAKPIAMAYRALLTQELKRLFRLDITSTGRPQEGRAVLRSGDRRFDVIAMILPTAFGENLSLQLINRDTFFKNYNELGLFSAEQVAFRAALSAQRGLILLAAPLFHGLTTTVYAVLKDLGSAEERKVMSVESHSICPVPGVTQVSLGENNDEADATTTMKAISLNHPGVCLIADMQNHPSMVPQTAALAAQMLVVLSLEANDCVQAVMHLMEAGFPREKLSIHLKLVLSQRLVRKICPDCARTIEVSDHTARSFGLTAVEALSLTGVKEGEGCKTCSMIGYKGRQALFELLSPSPAFRKALARGVTRQTLFKHAVKGGMVPMRRRALKAVHQGLTTLEEFNKESFLP